MSQNLARCSTLAILIALLVVVLPEANLRAQESPATLKLSDALRQRCLKVLRAGMLGEEFWPAIHAAEGLSLGGHGDEVRAYLEPKLAAEKDDQRRCGLARELVRAGDRRKATIMLQILAGTDPHGHVHAAESLYKVNEIGDGRAMRKAFTQDANPRLRLMAAAALGRWGSPAAMRFLREQLASEDAENGRIAAWILGRIGDQRDVVQLHKNLVATREPLARAYYAHSLAALGDRNGLRLLAKNLSADDAAIRTYAATFAGDARAMAVGAKLEDLLTDDNVDVRVRAAQSLLVLSQPAPADPQVDLAQVVYPATKDHPRHTEGSILELADGSMLFAATEFASSTSDFAKAQIVARRSSDGGRTWQARQVLQPRTGDMNVMSVTLRRLASPAPEGTLAMFYLEKNSYDDLRVYVRFSRDEARTFGPATRVTTEPGYHVLNNDRVTQLTSGRLLVPIASTPDVKKVNHFVSTCWLSDDGGRTWRKGKGQVDLPKRGAMEPEVIELAAGRLMMIMRTQLGKIATAYSSDGGDHWSEASHLPLSAPEAPATIRRIPSTGDLLLIWNNTYKAGAGHGGRRTPLTSAISTDEGRTWGHIRNLESDPARTFSYTSVAFSQGRALMSYWESQPNAKGLACKFRSVPISWFYAEQPSDK